jgi:hypothetical protein
MRLDAKNDSVGKSQHQFNCPIEWVSQQAWLGGHELQLS